mgnify:CR=1 FL=1
MQEKKTYFDDEIDLTELFRVLWTSKKLIIQITAIFAIGSVAYKLGLTGAGHADIFASLRPKNEWDICAGNCIINEAGGKLIDLKGNSRKYNQASTLIEPGLIAGDVNAVDKTFQVLNNN